MEKLIDTHCHITCDAVSYTHLVVVSPDHGGTTRARRLAEILHAPLAIIDKRRPKPNVAEAMNIIGDVNGKVAIMVDDIVDTAGTLTAGIEMLYDKGATAVYASLSLIHI